LLTSCKTGDAPNDALKVEDEPKKFYSLPEANPTDLDLSERPRLYIYNVNGKYGLLDANGNIKVEAQFDSIDNAGPSDVYEGVPFYIGTKVEIIPKENDPNKTFFIDADTTYKTFFINAKGDITKLGDFSSYVVRREYMEAALIYNNDTSTGFGEVYAYVPKSTGEFHLVNKSGVLDMTDDRYIISKDGASSLYDLDGNLIVAFETDFVRRSEEGNLFFSESKTKPEWGERSVNVYNKDGEFLFLADEDSKSLGNIIASAETEVSSNSFILKLYDAEAKREIGSYIHPYDRENPYDSVYYYFLNDVVLMEVNYPNGFHSRESGYLSPAQGEPANKFYVIVDKFGNKLYESVASYVYSAKDRDGAQRYIVGSGTNVATFDENFKELYAFTLPSSFTYFFSANAMICADNNAYSSSIVDWINSRGDDIKYIFSMDKNAEGYISAYENGFAEFYVTSGNAWLRGIVNAETGEIILDAKYWAANYYDDDMIWIETAYYVAYVNREGRVKFVRSKFSVADE
jgi:hypothetical protein